MENSGQTILYVIPTSNWNTKERIALKDMMIAKSSGYTVCLSTYLESYLAKIAIEQGIEVFPIQDHFVNRFTKFHKYYSISRVLSKVKIDIVHCYDFNFLFSLVFQLRSYYLTALVITQDHTVDKPLQKFWYRPLISRIDFLILLNKHLKSDLIGNLGLPLKKIEYFGMGIRGTDPENPSVIEFNFRPYLDYFLAGTYLSPEMNSIDSILPILFALKVINQGHSDKSLTKLVLMTDVDFKTLKIIKELKEKIEELEIQEEVLFVSTQDLDGVMTQLSLWISNGAQELIEDFAVLALIHEVPTIMPRNFCSKELLLDYAGVGELYKLYDSRELREKWSKIMLGKLIYKDKSRLFKFFIEKEHDYRIYRQDLLDLYIKMTQRRARVFGVATK